MIDDLIFVLKYYKRLNPTCLIVIENPEGYLHETKYAKMFEKKVGLKRVTLSYCMLSDENKLPRKHTSLWTNSKNLHHICRNDAYKCRHNCNARASNGRRHQKQVQDKDDRYASYPEEFNRFVRDNLLADVRAEQDEVGQTSSSAASSSSNSGSECDGTEVFEIERILGRRYNTSKRRVEYLIAWKGFDDHENTWEPPEHLTMSSLNFVQRRWGDSKPSRTAAIELTDSDLDEDPVRAFFEWEKSSDEEHE